MTRLTHFRPRATELRNLLQLALPIATVQVGIMMMGVVDTIMVGHISKEALAAVGIGNMYFFSAAIFGMGVLMALDPLVSQAVGAQDEDAIGRAVQRGFAIAIALTIVVGSFQLVAEPVLRALRQPEEIVPAAALYVRVLIPGILPFFVFIVLRQTLQSLGTVAPIVWSIVFSNLLNLLLNYLLIYGHFGFPRMGVAGSAWATSASRLMLMLALLVMAWPRLKHYVRPLHPDSFAFAPVLRMLRLGAPIGFHHMLEYGAFMAVMVIMGSLGTTQIASHQVAINLASLTFMVPFGIAQAGGVLVGHAVGRGEAEAARRASGAALLGGIAFMSVAGIIFLVMPRLLASAYTADAAVIALSASLIQLAGLFQIFDGLQVVAAGILRGVGDTRVPMIVGLIGFWLIGMPVSLFFGLSAGLGAIGLWWGLVAGLGAVALFLLIRVYLRLGGDLSRVVIDEPAVA